VGRDRAVDGARGQVAKRFDLVAGNAGGAGDRRASRATAAVWDRAETRGRDDGWWAAALPSTAGRDGLEQRLEGEGERSRQSVKGQRDRSAREFGVAGAEMGQRSSRSKGSLRLRPS